jgi:hypothetical protein
VRASLLLFHVAIADGSGRAVFGRERRSVGEDTDRRRRGRQAPAAAAGAARRDRRSDRRNRVGSPVDPYRLGDTPMSTRTIAIAALVIAVVIVVILFVI